MLSQHLYDSAHMGARICAPREFQLMPHTRLAGRRVVDCALKQCLAFHALAASPSHVVEMQQLIACIPVLYA